MCQCVNIEIGSHDNQALLDPPDHMKQYRKAIGEDLNYMISVDKCLKEEINELWAAGITTTGCCCGHNKIEPYIGVIDQDIERMKIMGYEVFFNASRPRDEDSFIPKTVKVEVK